MLQIISGKFFSTAKERYRFEAKGIMYSNFSLIKPIITEVVKLEVADNFSQTIASYVMSYVNQIEKDEKSVLLRTGDEEIINQFRLLCIFGLQAYFSPYRDQVEMNCRDKGRSSDDRYIPSQMVKRFFDNNIVETPEKIDKFVKFVNHIIGLPRDSFEMIMKCLGNFSNSLQVVNYDMDLAYSMMVYSLESLAQDYDGYDPVWTDYDRSVAECLDKELLKIENDCANNIRNILLKSSHLKLQKRFVEFTVSHIKDSFFLDEAIDVQRPIKKSDVRQAMKNAYIMRSKFVHNLKNIQKELKIPSIAEADTFSWENEIYLTYNGLVRLGHHVIYNFIMEHAIVEKESIDWHSKLPNIINVELAPEYWIASYKFFRAEDSVKKFQGFLEQIQEAFISQKPITDIKLLLKKMELMLDQTQYKTDKYKIIMSSIIILFYAIIEPKSEKNKEILRKYDSNIKTCGIETLIVGALLLKALPWSGQECEVVYQEYLEKKYRKNALRIPMVINVVIIIKIANKFLIEGNKDKFRCWMKKAVLDLSGIPIVQNLIDEYIVKEDQLDTDLIFDKIKNT